MKYWKGGTADRRPGGRSDRPPQAGESAAHRDGSPYPLRMGRLSDPKEVGRTVPVSRRGKRIFFVLFVYFVEKMKLQAMREEHIQKAFRDNFAFRR